MATRKVFGRRIVSIRGKVFFVELRAQGVYVKQSYQRAGWVCVSFLKLSNLAEKEPVLFPTWQEPVNEEKK